MQYQLDFAVKETEAQAIVVTQVISRREVYRAKTGGLALDSELSALPGASLSRVDDLILTVQKMDTLKTIAPSIFRKAGRVMPFVQPQRQSYR